MSAVAAALAGCAATLDVLGPERWKLVPGAGRSAIEARVVDGWLELEATCRPAQAPRHLLARNGALDGGARFVLGATGNAVRADVPLGAAADLGGRLAEACAGLHAAGVGLGDGGPHAEPAHAPRANGAGADLAARLGETPWPFTVREPDGLVVDLEAPGVFCQATLAAREDGRIAVATPVAEALGDETVASEVCERALAIFLLRAGGAVRMARTAADGADVARARFEVVFASPPSAGELAHALAALSVACRLATREAAVLRADEGVARAYLEISES